MHHINDYDVYVFDCDGVILDSNSLKIEAMKKALSSRFSDEEQISRCVTYFGDNFGKSRFHHIDIFVNEILYVADEDAESTKELILQKYSEECKKLYLKAEITPGFIKFISSLDGKKYVASGSEQKELREIFHQRGLYIHFNEVFGSPTSKYELIKTILKWEGSRNAVMFGDSESDLTSAMKNEIDFIFYSPFSTVRARMLELCSLHQFPVVNDFSKVKLK